VVECLPSKQKAHESNHGLEYHLSTMINNSLGNKTNGNEI
jgi:hypothetical protein